MYWSMDWSKDPQVAIQQVKEHFVRFDRASGRVLPISLMKIRYTDREKEYDKMLQIYPEVDEFRVRAFFNHLTQAVPPEPASLIIKGGRMPYMSTPDFKFINDRVFLRAFSKK